MSTETIETLIRLRNKLLAHGLTVAAEIVHDELTNDHGECTPRPPRFSTKLSPHAALD